MWHKIIFFGIPFATVFITLILFMVRIDEFNNKLESITFAFYVASLFSFFTGAVGTLLFAIVSPYHYTEATSGVLYVVEQKTYSKENKLLYFIETVNGEIIVPTSYNPSDVGKKVEVLVREKWVIDQQMDIRIDAELSEVD